MWQLSSGPVGESRGFFLQSPLRFQFIKMQIELIVLDSAMKPSQVMCHGKEYVFRLTDILPYPAHVLVIRVVFLHEKRDAALTILLFQVLCNMIQRFHGLVGKSAEVEPISIHPNCFIIQD